MWEKHLTDKIHREPCQLQMKLWKFQAEKKNKFRNATPHIEWPPVGVIGIVIPSRMLCQNTAKIIMACVIYRCVPFQVSDKPAQCLEFRSYFSVHNVWIIYAH
jgi:hypothetical protein